MQHLRANGRVVYLKCALDVLDQRIASMDERGIAAPSGQTLADVQAERIPLYEQYAEITVEVGSENMDSALGKIIQHLNL
jgi:shikimate kinase